MALGGWRGARDPLGLRRGTEATWGAGGADAWQEATRTDPRGRPCGPPHGRGFADGGPTGIVSPGK